MMQEQELRHLSALYGLSAVVSVLVPIVMVPAREGLTLDEIAGRAKSWGDELVRQRETIEDSEERQRLRAGMRDFIAALLGSLRLPL